MARALLLGLTISGVRKYRGQLLGTRLQCWPDGLGVHLDYPYGLTVHLDIGLPHTGDEGSDRLCKDATVLSQSWSTRRGQTIKNRGNA